MVAPGSRRPRGAKLCPWTPWGLWGALAPARRGARCRRRGMAAPGAAAMRPHSGAKSSRDTPGPTLFEISLVNFQ